MAIRAASIWLLVIQAGSSRHQAEVAVGDKIASGGFALHTASVYSAVFYSLRH